MPSLHILKRSGREPNSSPWSPRPQTRGNAGGSPQTEPGHHHDNDQHDDERSHDRGHGLCIDFTSGTDTIALATTSPLSPSSPSSSSPTSPPPTKRERRDSKRDLLHGLISRSIRRPSRSLTANPLAGQRSPVLGHDGRSPTLPASPPTSQPTSQPNKLQKPHRQHSGPAQTGQSPDEHQGQRERHIQSQDRDQAQGRGQKQHQKLQSPPPTTRNHRRGKSSVTTAATAATGLSAFSAATSTTQDSSTTQARRDPNTTPLLSSPSRSGLVVNTNKPLPSPPLPGSELDLGPPAKPVLKLTRIMASLSDDDIEKLFSGAPQYYARSEGHFTGAPHPSVAYPWDESLQIRDLTDHIQIEDKAWGVVTAWPHITRRPGSSSSNSNSINNTHKEAAGDPAAEPTPAFKKRGHYFPRCRERPSMLSMQGLEKGTIGYEAALELSVSDALQEEQYGFDSLGARPQAIQDARRNLLDPQVVAASKVAVRPPTSNASKPDGASSDEETSNGGVNSVGESQILEELIKNGRRYADGSFYDEKQSKEFYDELFHHILRPPKRKASVHRRSASSSSSSGSGTDTIGSLTSQIEALLDVLATPNVWIDFSHVEWRLRVGQILWTSTPEDDFDDGVRHSQDGQAATVDERYTERYWLLLQILLSTELLLRLDAITDGDEIGLEFVHPTLVHRFEKEANQAVRWSLILARAWLENVDVVRLEEHEPEEKNAGEVGSPLHKLPSNHSILSKGGKHRDKHTIGWISTLTKKLSMEGHAHPVVPHKRHVYVMKSKHAPRQQYGIFHFAQELRWPDETPDRLPKDILDGKELLNAKIPNPAAAAGTSPRSSLSKTRLEFNRQLPRRRKVVAGLHKGGWLSKTYLSGLMLPGDSLCNLLMATLLEGDEAALKTLGPIAHLGSGFVYRGMSFWSTACVVGRVLGAGAGASDCMSWVSSDVVPTGGLGEGWVNVDVDDVRDDVRQTNRRARIWGKAAIERESYVLGDAEPENVLPADFVIPYEAVYKEQPPAHTRVDLQRFELYTPYERKQRATRLKAEAGQAGGTISEEKKDAGVDSQTTATKSYFAEIAFAVSSDGAPEEVFTYDLSYDIYFVTAHPCVPPSRVKVLKSPTSPTIQQIDVTGTGLIGRSTSMHVTGHPLHKYYTYAAIHLSSLIKSRDKTLEQLLAEHAASINRTASTKAADIKPARVLVIDCITGFSPQPSASEMPLSPVVDGPRQSIDSSISSLPPLTKEISPIASLSAPVLAQPLVPATATSSGTHPRAPTINTSTSSSRPTTAPGQSAMHHETRRRRFGSDMEILVRAICAEKGWNAVISRRRRGCLACAIREAGALGWKVVIRVD